MIDLACLAQRLRAQGRILMLRDPQPHVRRLIELVGLDRLPAVSLTEAGSIGPAAGVGAATA
jgi:anti-anti-sigma regulatory factor